jgi:5'-phosphate synthase pdxT subunit
MKVGILALQGAFFEHINILQNLNVNAVPIRLPQELAGLDGIVLPGGESTSILKIMRDFGITNPLKNKIEDGLPVWGTCAGMICLANEISSDGLTPLNVMDISVKRNAFGRQIDSFETDLEIPVLGPELYHAVFIRAPVITRVGKSVEVLAKLADGTPVAAVQNNMLATSFHPELTGDFRFHRYFLKLISDRPSTSHLT